MAGYFVKLEEEALSNDSFRKVLYTARYSQLVLMSLEPGEEIGEEIHELDQFIRVESGSGKAVLDGKEYQLSDGGAVVIPAGCRHNVINGTGGKMKLYTVYSPPEHKDGVVHKTKADARADAGDRFDGAVTER